MGFNGIYPLVNIQKAMENAHRNSGFTHYIKMVIFRSKMLVYQRVGKCPMTWEYKGHHLKK